MELAKATEELSTRLGRMPTVKELADLMSLAEEEVTEALLASNGYNSSSLDAALSGEDEDSDASPADFIGREDPAMALVEDYHSLAPLIADLDERDRRIIHLRFVEELTQAQIGEQLGCSQMHVSRLLARTVKRLREGLLGTGAG